MSRQEFFKTFIRNQLRENNQAIETMDIILNDNEGRDITELELECEYAKSLFEDIKDTIEEWTGFDYCPWGDEEMIYHNEEIIDLCIENTKSDLETIVWSYFTNMGKINTYMYNIRNNNISSNNQDNY